MSDHDASGFPVRCPPPDLSRWRGGNTGLPGIWTFDAAAPGPHVAVLSLVHGNEYGGAAVLAAMLAAGTMPVRGRLSFGFVNLAAFDRFDPLAPTQSRFIEEDLNRLWDPAVLDGNRQSAELSRARALRPWIEQVDVLLDLHSMLWPSDPLILCGMAARGCALARRLGQPRLVVADAGHRGGARLIDYPRFTDHAGHATAILVEAGQHWEEATQHVMHQVATGFLAETGIVPGSAHAEPTQLAEVTDAVTAETAEFAFVRPFRGGDIVRDRNTLIALDGTTEIRTPYDHCLLVMPSLRPTRGHTAVRLARLIADAPAA